MRVRRGDLHGGSCSGREDSPLGAPRRTPTRSRFIAQDPSPRTVGGWGWPVVSTPKPSRIGWRHDGRVRQRDLFWILRDYDYEIVGAHHSVLLPGQPLEGHRIAAQSLDSPNQFVVLGSGLSNLSLQGLPSLSSRRQVPIAAQGCQSQEQQQRADYQSQQSGKGSWRLGCHDTDQRALLGKAALPG